MSAESHRSSTAALTLGALGVVFGDIGTSPLYALQTVFERDATKPVPIDPSTIYGVISLVLWTVVVLVTLKYVTFIMRADNDGEGGIMALIALLMSGRATTTKVTVVLSTLGIFGAALFFGDSMITPAISVLSAVEGAAVVAPSLDSLVVPIAAVILVVLFAAQQLGTGAVGRAFGPIMAVWFTTIAAFGVKGITDHPGVLRAVSPTYAVQFFGDHGLTAFLALGGVVLAVTGAEALYADMGHFGRTPIRRAWLLAVFPALVLNYLGQGALLIDDPSAAGNPFFMLIPHWARIPMVVLATVATVIASQAVISGAFSVVRQAVQLGSLPRLRIVHTSSEEIGQVYVPGVNWTILVGVLALVFVFERSSRLASAYGIAVTATVGITSVLFFVVAQRRLGFPRWLAGALMAAFAVVDVAFLGANLVKLVHGGWLPVVIALVVFTTMTTWQRGRVIVTANRDREEGPLEDFVMSLRDGGEGEVVRVPGTAVFLNRGDGTTPLAMRATVEHNHVLHEHAVVMTIHTLPRPHVPASERLVLSDLGFADDGISHVTAQYGYLDSPHVPDALEAASRAGLEAPVDLNSASYFLSRIELRATDAPGMSKWRKRLFLATSQLSSDPVEYFALPRERTVIMGSQIGV